MSEPSQPTLEARLDDLMKEVRRQGRAAIAAQAAAESCLAAIQELDARDDDSDDTAGAEDAATEAERWLRAMIPALDALDRIVKQAAALAEPRPRVKRSLLQRLVGAPEATDDRATLALAEGLRLLQAQLEGALGDRGVAVDRRTGEAVDGERHRVVEVRPQRSGERPGTVVEVVRAGYALGSLVVREAEVVTAEQRSAKAGS
jgi:molecular chaperone GrpE (heat shock protein)